MEPVPNRSMHSSGACTPFNMSPSSSSSLPFNRFTDRRSLMGTPTATALPSSTSTSSHFSVDRIQSFYDRKTRVLLHRYGPGPRVHYHSGIVTEDYDPQGSFLSLKTIIYQSQEQLMVQLAREWNALTNLNREV